MKLLTMSQKRKLVDWIAGKLGVYHSYADEPIYVIEEKRLGHIIVRYTADIPIGMPPYRADKILAEGLMEEIMEIGAIKVDTKNCNNPDIMERRLTATLNILVKR